jgi:hypothetical protein
VTKRTRPATLEDIKLLVTALNREGAEYALVGAHALSLYAVARATEDIDFLVRGTRENGEKVRKALMVLADKAAKDLDPSWFEEREGIKIADEIEVDLLFVVGNEQTWESLRPHVVATQIEGVEVRTLDPEGLLKSKQTVRSKDLPDRLLLEQLLRAIHDKDNDGDGDGSGGGAAGGPPPRP